MSLEGAEMVFGLIHKIGSLRGGSHRLYKPVVRVEWYDHDDRVTVEIGRCKSMDEIVLIKTAAATGPDQPATIIRALQEVLDAMLKSGAS